MLAPYICRVIETQLKINKMDTTISTSRKFTNPVTGKKQIAAVGVSLYGFDENGALVYGEATDKKGTLHLMGQVIDVKHSVQFKI